MHMKIPGVRAVGKRARIAGRALWRPFRKPIVSIGNLSFGRKSSVLVFVFRGNDSFRVNLKPEKISTQEVRDRLKTTAVQVPRAMISAAALSEIENSRKASQHALDLPGSKPSEHPFSFVVRAENFFKKELFKK